MTIFFTSDQHYSHSRIISYSSRPFSSIDEMNNEIIKRYNEVVGPEDTVYHLGDFTLNSSFVKPTLEKLNGTKHLIAGNHEACYSARPKHKKEIKKYLEYGFSSVQEIMELKLGEHTFTLSHLPFLKPDHADQRYSQFRPIDKGQFLLHGHVHNCWKINGRMINVGVDVHNYTPVSETQILELVADIIEGEQL